VELKQNKTKINQNSPKYIPNLQKMRIYNGRFGIAAYKDF
jgi:hypothetical protein